MNVVTWLRQSACCAWLAWMLSSTECSLLVDADQYTVAEPTLGAGGGAQRGSGQSMLVTLPVRESCEQNPLLAKCGRSSVENILFADCGSCHGSSAAAQRTGAGMNYIDDIDRLLEAGKIRPLDSEDSTIVVRILRGALPPLSSSAPSMSDQDLDTLRGFIDDPYNWPDYN